jgi:hypothetical protein
VNAPPGIVVTLGPCDDMRAEVFVRVPRPAAADAGRGPLRLEGSLTGPQCRRATTLPMAARLVDLGPPAAANRGPADVAVARAVVTEPAFWTPDLPNLYRLEATCHVGDESLAVIEARVGLRRLGARGRSLWLDGRRWVPRGVRTDAGFAAETFHERATTAVMVNPDEATCSRADADGVALIAIPETVDAGLPPVAACTDLITGWALHPAVVMALLPPGTTAAEAEAVATAVRKLKGTLLVGWHVDGGEPPPRAGPSGIDWLAVAVGPDRSPHAAWREAAPLLPLVACGADGGGRAACDSLQAALAAWGLAAGGDRVPWDWAGYVVW